MRANLHFELLLYNYMSKYDLSPCSMNFITFKFEYVIYGAHKAASAQCEINHRWFAVKRTFFAPPS